MKFKQSFITIKQRTMQSSPKNHNNKNLLYVFQSRVPHSSYSEPLCSKIKQNILKKTISVSSEEQKLKEQIAELDTRKEESYANKKAYQEAFNKYQGLFMEALQRGDKETIKLYQPMMQRYVKLIQQQGKAIDQYYAEINRLYKQLQKLQARKI